MSHRVFEDYVADTLAALPGVCAVALAGSRATGTHGPDSDWDFALYYRGTFDPEHLRAVGWRGEVSPIGGWGGGVFNGGAWLQVRSPRRRALSRPGGRGTPHRGGMRGTVPH